MSTESTTPSNQEREEIFVLIRSILVDLFDFEADSITPESHIVHDLDLDSIDAVDIIVKIQENTGKKLDPDQFKQIETIADIVEEACK